MRYAIGVDLGGTELRAGLVTIDGVLVAHDQTRTAAEQGPAAVIDQIEGLVSRIIKDVRLMHSEIATTVVRWAMLPYRNTPIVAAMPGPKAGVVGAATLVMDGRRMAVLLDVKWSLKSWWRYCGATL